MTQPDFTTISAAIRVGDWPQVERLAQASLAQHPHREELLFMLAVSLQMLERTSEALEAYERLIDLHSDNANYWGNYATELRKAGRLDDAGQAHANALRLKPDDVHELVNFGLLQLERHDFLDARATMLKALALAPDSPEVRIRAARAHDACREYYESEELLAPWRQWLPLEDGLQLELGDLLLSIGDGSHAVAVLDDLVRRAPGNTLAKIRLASAYERINRVSDAEAVLAGITPDRIPTVAFGKAELAYVVARIAQRNGDLAVAASILEDSGARGDSDFAHYFNLAEIYAKQGQVDPAMRALDTAHAVQMRDLKKVVPARFEPGATVLPAAQRLVAAAEVQHWPRLASPDARQSPVFIVGFPRSGTTLLEQMLDAHPSLQSMDENPFFNRLADQLAEQHIYVPHDIHRLGQRDCDELRRRYLTMVCRTVPRQWDAQIVDKNPLNMLWLPFIYRLFPEAKFILALRHPCDVILSCYMQNFRSNMLAAACTTLERLATAYVASMRNWLHHVDLLQPAVLNVRNEDLIADAPAQAARIADFLELADSSPLLRFDQHARNKGFIATPSYSQVIQPINSKGMNRWLRYRDYLDPVLPILEPMLRHWEYSTVGEPRGATPA